MDSVTSDGVAGVVLGGEPGGLTAETDDQGYYEIMAPLGWQPSPSKGTVTPAKYAFSFEPAAIDYNDVARDVLEQNYVATEIRPAITGMITDGNNMGISGVRIISDPNIGSTVSDPNGGYALAVPYGYTGTIMPQRQSTEFVPESRYYEDLTEPIGDQDYEAMGLFHRISGRITGPSGAGLSGVWIPFDPNYGEILTDEQGYYCVDVPDLFTGVIEPVKYGYVLQPDSRPYLEVTAPIEAQDYTVTAVFFD